MIQAISSGLEKLEKSDVTSCDGQIGCTVHYSIVRRKIIQRTMWLVETNAIETMLTMFN